MNHDKIKSLLQNIKDQKTSIEQGIEEIKKMSFLDLGFAKIDFHRRFRKGFPEVIYCQNKTKEQVLKIIKEIDKNGQNILATRLQNDQIALLNKKMKGLIINETARVAYKINEPMKKRRGDVLILCAGTSDIPIAEEAAVTAEVMGANVKRGYDVGVAGIHRLFKYQDELANANVVIVVAGMEGALASVVGGLTPAPIIAVPTSVGYGASFNGLSALLTMLNSCSAGVAVVNIDNGFGAGFFASLINRPVEKEK